jgi:hypothetical protein
MTKEQIHLFVIVEQIQYKDRQRERARARERERYLRNARGGWATASCILTHIW